MYSFPLWRQAPFIALLIVVLVIAYAPATTQGTTTVRFSALRASNLVTHIYVQVSSAQAHVEGFPNSTGWTSFTQAFPIVDMVSGSNQSISGIIASSTVHSGRFDELRIFFTNSTVVADGTRTSVAAPAPIDLKPNIAVSPNGTTDVLILVAIDYTSLFANPPTLSFTVIQTSIV